MKAIKNYESVQATSREYAKPTAGGYVIGILNAVDVPLDANTGKGDYLKVFYDIAEGDFKYYYTEQNKKFGGDYFINFIKSYKEKALGMFKHFTNCLEESNAGYKWDWNEKGLKGRLLGVVLGEEEYEKNDGSIGVRLYVKDIKTVEQIRNGDFKVPELKKIERKENSDTSDLNDLSSFEEITTDDLPF